MLQKNRANLFCAVFFILLFIFFGLEHQVNNQQSYYNISQVLLKYPLVYRAYQVHIGYMPADCSPDNQQSLSVLCLCLPLNHEVFDSYYHPILLSIQQNVVLTFTTYCSIIFEEVITYATNHQ